MNIHEYQAKVLLGEFQVPVARGAVVFSPKEAVAVAESLGGPVWVVKSQIHAGGRGKGRFKESTAGDLGGVRVVKSIDAVRESAAQMLGNTLVTHQTGPDGKTVKRVYVEQGSGIKRELYLSCLVDRSSSRVAFICSTEGEIGRAHV